MQKRRLISYSNEYLSLDFRIDLIDVDSLIKQLNDIKFNLALADDQVISPSKCIFEIFKIQKSNYQLNMAYGKYFLSFYIDLDSDNICQQFKYAIDEHAVPLALTFILPAWVDVVIFLLVFQQRLRKSVSYGV